MWKNAIISCQRKFGLLKRNKGQRAVFLGELDAGKWLRRPQRCVIHKFVSSQHLCLYFRFPLKIFLTDWKTWAILLIFSFLGFPLNIIPLGPYWKPSYLSPRHSPLPLQRRKRIAQCPRQFSVSSGSTLTCLWQRSEMTKKGEGTSKSLY